MSLNYFKMGFMQSIGVFGSSKVISTIIIFSVGVLTARILSPDGRGEYALFFTIVGLGSNLSNPGISQANTYFLNKEKILPSILVGNSIFAILVASTLWGVLLLIALKIGLIELIGLRPDAFWVLLLWIATIVTFSEISFSGLVYGHHLYQFQSKSIVIQATLILVSTLLILPIAVDVTGALWLRTLALTLFSVWYVYSFWMRVKPFELSFSFRCLQKQIGFGLKNWLQNLVGIINYRGYFLILGIFSSPEQIGYFSVALLLIEAVRFVPDTVGTILLPHLVKTKDSGRAKELVATTCRVSLFITFLVSLILFLITEPLVVFIFGLEYYEAIKVLQILLLGAMFGTIYQVMTRYFTSIALQKFSIFSAISALFVAVLSSSLLVPIFEASGAATAFCLSTVTSSILILIFFSRTSGLSVYKILFVSKGDIQLAYEFFKSFYFKLGKK